MKKVIETIKTLIIRQEKKTINGIPLYIVHKLEADEKPKADSFRWKNGRERFNSPHHI